MEATLSSGHTIQIDVEDQPLLDRHPWRAYRVGGKLRVIAPVDRGGRREMLYLARLIAGARARRQVRHRNGDTLDLRRGNLEARGLYPCPFSAGRLLELYQDEGRSRPRIARLAADAAGWPSAPPAWVVSQWLDAAGIARQGGNSPLDGQRQRT